jgi:hypothetical protein
VTDDKCHAIADQLSRRRDRLLWVARVVNGNHPDLLAEHATLGVEILDRKLGAPLILLANPAERPGQRASIPDQDLRVGRRGDRQRHGKNAE